MSWCNRRLFLVSPLALAACGFEPAYAPGGSADHLTGRVRVDDPGYRDTFLLVQALESELGRSADPVYALSFTLSTFNEGLAINPAGDVTRINVVGTANYALRNIETGAIAASGRVENFTGFSNTGSTVSTFAADRDARARLMQILADEIVRGLYAKVEPPE